LRVLLWIIVHRENWRSHTASLAYTYASTTRERIFTRVAHH
jgi:hypothetical protein